MEALSDKLFKADLGNWKKQALIDKLQKKAVLEQANDNNTSSSFPLPSEFKAKWDDFVSESVLDAFGILLDDYKTFSLVLNQAFSVMNFLVKN